MKKSVGILKGKKLVIGQENLVTKNEILLKKNEDSLELSIRNNDEMTVISGGSAPSSEAIEYLSYMINTNGNSIENVEYFLSEKYAIKGRYFPDDLRELTYIDPNELVISQYPTTIEVGARNPYIYLFSGSNNSIVVDSVSFHYNKIDGSEGTLSSKCSKVFYIDTRNDNYVVLKEENWSRDLSINSTFPHIIIAVIDSKSNLIMLIGRHYSGNKVSLKSLFDKLVEKCGIKVDYSNMKSVSYH